MSFLFDFVPDRYKSQEMCDKAVDDFLPALKFVPKWFITSKLVKKLYYASSDDDDILPFDEDSDFLVMKSVFLVYVFIILALMALILMEMILKLLFMPDL